MGPVDVVVVVVVAAQDAQVVLTAQAELPPPGTPPGKMQDVKVVVEAQVLPSGVLHAVESVGRSVGSNVEKLVSVAVGVIETGVLDVDEVVDVVLVGGSISSMVVVRVVSKTQDPDPKVVLTVPVTEHPDSTRLLVVVHEDDPGAVVVHDTKKSVTVAVEQDEVTVLVVSESSTAHPTMLVHVEATLVVEGPTDDVVAHSVADSVSHSSGLDEYVGL